MIAGIETFLLEFWKNTAEMAPYLLLGFAMAGLLSAFISSGTVERHLGGRGLWPVLKATLFGIPLPLCSCGVIPVAASLRRHGASRGATTGFLLSTPQTGVDSILVTYSLLGPVMAVVRPLAALVTGITGGWLVSKVNEKDARQPASDDDASCADCGPEALHGNRWVHALRYGFVTLPRDIARALLIGLAVAALIGAVLPDDFAGSLGRGFIGLVGMMLVGIPIYVCATGSVPIAAALMLKGVSPGAALVFLMTGPATNAATVTTVWKILGKRSALVYLVTVAVSALAAGWLLDALFPSVGEAVRGMHHHETIGPFKTISAVLLLGILIPALLPRRRRQAAEQETAMKETLHLSIAGMNCSHCADSVRRALSETAGVDEVSVDLDAGRAVVRGERLEGSKLEQAVESLGYTVESVSTA